MNEMERLLHYIWKYKLYRESDLRTTEGVPIKVIDPGMLNTDAGPDFFNAKVRISGIVWAGSVEIHQKASDWMKHHHDTDKAYDSVILHVVQESDRLICRTNGELIPQAVLKVDPAVQANIDWLLQKEVPIPCLPRIGEVRSIDLSAWLDTLLSERLERKTQDIFILLEQYKNDWNEVFYIILTRNFGFGMNSDAFERLAKSLPFSYIRKQRSGSSQVEALLFGQAGLLEEELPDEYYRLLKREYGFLQKKFDLQAGESSLVKNLRVRPSGFPHLKIAQLAAIWGKYDTLFSLILEAETPEKAKGFFRILPSPYWETHYNFRQTSVKKEKYLGEKSLQVLLINTVVPMLFAYGQRKKQPEYSERALSFLEQIPAESNRIVSIFAQAGIKVQHAGDSQALIQLKREYCEKKKCLYCRIGFRLFENAASHRTRES